MRIHDIIGKKFNHLLVISESEKIWYDRFFLCKCDCWNMKDILLSNIIWLRQKSCWCYFKKTILLDIRKIKMKRVWFWIIQRTTNKNIKQYNDWWWRWIKCEWSSFDQFYNDMKDSWKEWLSLDRIDNNWNYCKSNCRWATREEQQWNTRKNILVDWICIKQYCKINNLNYWAINMRLHIWWTLEKALNTPVKKLKRRNYI